MKRFGFDTFEVNDLNRDALEVCRSVAELLPVTPQPVVLVGEKGCGKTHLLYSVANRVGKHTSKTGLVYVTASDFPQQVRDYVRNPKPVQRARSAILLVDQLERFTSHVDDLEAVVRIFLDSKHAVVLASAVHPRQLKNVPESLQGLLQRGQIVQIRSKPVDAPPAETEIAPPAQAEAKPDEGKDEEIEASSIEAAHAAEHAVEIWRELRQERSRAKDLEAVIEAERRVHAILRDQAAKAQEEIEAIKKIAESDEGESEQVRILNEETAYLRDKLHQARAAHDTVDKERRALAAVIERHAADESEMLALRKALEAARAETAAVRSAGPDARLAALAEAIESNTAKAAEREARHREQLAALDTLIQQCAAAFEGGMKGEQAKAEIAKVADRFEALRNEFADARKLLESDLAAARDEARKAGEAQAAAEKKARDANAALIALEKEIDRLRNESSAKGKEMENLRREAAMQVAAANAQAGEVERAKAQMAATIEVAGRKHAVVAEELRTLRERFLDATKALESVAARLATLEAPATAADTDAAESEALNQAIEGTTKRGKGKSSKSK